MNRQMQFLTMAAAMLTVTARREVGPEFQDLPPSEKPPEIKKYVHTDYAKVEARVIAHMMQKTGNREQARRVRQMQRKGK